MAAQSIVRTKKPLEERRRNARREIARQISELATGMTDKREATLGIYRESKTQKAKPDLS
jgi:hypothetical protein